MKEEKLPMRKKASNEGIKAPNEGRNEGRKPQGTKVPQGQLPMKEVTAAPDEGSKPQGTKVPQGQLPTKE